MNKPKSRSSDTDAMQKIQDILNPLEDRARRRVVDWLVDWLADYFDIQLRYAEVNSNKTSKERVNDDKQSEACKVLQESSRFSTFSELHANIAPTSNLDKALIAGYWIQEYEGEGNFTAAAANKALNHLGHKVLNITSALDLLKKKKPALVIQIKKSGSGQKARKIYKVSDAGMKKVQGMISV